jgi:hypothetical protein
MPWLLRTFTWAGALLVFGACQEPSSGTPWSATNLGLAYGTLLGSLDDVLVRVEAKSGLATDLGLALERLQLYEPTSERLTNLGLAASAPLVPSPAHARGFLAIDEFAQGRDLTGDGDVVDVALFVLGR